MWFVQANNAFENGANKMLEGDLSSLTFSFGKLLQVSKKKDKICKREQPEFGDIA